MKINILTTSIALSALISFNASAYDAYNLHSDKWAIECSDGELAAFSGDEAGLKNAGSTLCESNGGVAGAKDDLVVKKFTDAAQAESPLTEGRAGESESATKEEAEEAPVAATDDAKKDDDKVASKEEAAPADNEKK